MYEVIGNTFSQAGGRFAAKGGNGVERFLILPITSIPGVALSRTWGPHFAAIHLIAHAAFPGDERVWQHVDVGRQEVRFEDILEHHTFTRLERILLIGA